MRYLYVTVLLLFFASCNNRPVEIYPMSNIWELFGEHKREYYVVYNTRWKSPQEIEESILAFNRKTIEMDTVLKYREVIQPTVLCQDKDTDTRLQRTRQ